jgi:hypothetical protein
MTRCWPRSNVNERAVKIAPHVQIVCWENTFCVQSTRVRLCGCAYVRARESANAGGGIDGGRGLSINQGDLSLVQLTPQS